MLESVLDRRLVPKILSNTKHGFGIQFFEVLDLQLAFKLQDLLKRVKPRLTNPKPWSLQEFHEKVEEAFRGTFALGGSLEKRILAQKASVGPFKNLSPKP